MTLKRVVAEVLEARLRTEQTMTYTELANQLSVKEPVYPFPNNPLAGIFGELEAEDAANHRPLRISVVISKELNMPGPGFFATLDRLHQTKTSKEDRLARWLAEYKSARQQDYSG